MLCHMPARCEQNNIHHRAFGLGGQSGGGRNLAAATDFFASAVGYAKSFVSNNHEFCFLGDTETRRKQRQRQSRAHGGGGGHGGVRFRVQRPRNFCSGSSSRRATTFRIPSLAYRFFLRVSVVNIVLVAGRRAKSLPTNRKDGCGGLGLMRGGIGQGVEKIIHHGAFGLGGQSG